MQWNRTGSPVAAVLILLGAGTARAVSEDDVVTARPLARTEPWSATAGLTVGDGNSVIQGEVGWPALSVTYLRGLDDRTDIGGRVSVAYGFEGTVNNVAGLALQVPIRRRVMSSGMLDVSVHADPGLSFYGGLSSGEGLLFGIGGPVGAVAGWRVSDAVTLDAGADVPLLLNFTSRAGLIFTPEVGVGAEYNLDPKMALTFRTRFGPTIAAVSNGAFAQFSFSSLIGLAYNMR